MLATLGVGLVRTHAGLVRHRHHGEPRPQALRAGGALPGLGEPLVAMQTWEPWNRFGP